MNNGIACFSVFLFFFLKHDITTRALLTVKKKKRKKRHLISLLAFPLLTPSPTPSCNDGFMASRIVNGRRFPSKRDWKDEVGLKPLKAPKSSPNSPPSLLMASPFSGKETVGVCLFGSGQVVARRFLPEDGPGGPLGSTADAQTRLRGTQRHPPPLSPSPSGKKKSTDSVKGPAKEKKNGRASRKAVDEACGEKRCRVQKRKKRHTSACLRESEAMKHFIKGKLVPSTISCLSEHSFYFV